jgi:hypothetical protein
MELELKELLTGLDTAVAAKLAENDVRTIEDCKLLTKEDFAELGFSIGVRNKLIRIFASATPKPPSLLVRKEPTSGSPTKSGTPRGATYNVSKDLPPDLGLFLAAINYESDTDPAIKEKRAKLYPCWDTNGNGFLSLAECDLGIKSTLSSALGMAEGDRIWKRFRKCYIRAFADAKDAAPDLHRLKLPGKQQYFRNHTSIAVQAQCVRIAIT